jgi:endonuclease/exonuclease/phosphatase family metal-dependent hydrolase
MSNVLHTYANTASDSLFKHTSDSTTLLSKTSVNQLKILTWNIYMLPYCSLVNGNCQRARMIASQLSDSDYDVIVFQEAFNLRARGILKRHLRKNFPYMYGPANMPVLSFRFNSGIWVVSKIPLKKIEEIEYHHRFGVDAFARKGAVMFEGSWYGQPFQLVGTHLQADSPDSIRQGQCREMATRLLNKHAREHVPQIVCGDFNIETSDPENYHYMLTTLNAENGIFSGEIHSSYDEIDNSLAKRPNGKKQMIDYVLVRNSKFFQSIRRKIAVHRAPAHPKYKDLSDHYGVEAIFEFAVSHDLTARIPSLSVM